MNLYKITYKYGDIDTEHESYVRYLQGGKETENYISISIIEKFDKDVTTYKRSLERNGIFIGRFFFIVDIDYIPAEPQTKLRKFLLRSVLSFMRNSKIDEII